MERRKQEKHCQGNVVQIPLGETPTSMVWILARKNTENFQGLKKTETRESIKENEVGSGISRTVYQNRRRGKA